MRKFFMMICIWSCSMYLAYVVGHLSGAIEVLIEVRNAFKGCNLEPLGDTNADPR